MSIENIEGQFLEQGYVVREVADFEAFARIGNVITAEIESALGVKVQSLEKLHEYLPIDRVNEVRVRAYNALNACADVVEDCYKVFRPGIDQLLGTELASQNKVNLSIQLPNDETSLVGLHTDTVSGQSEFEVVCWLPFTKTFDTNSVYVFSMEDSRKMLAQLPQYHTKGMEALYQDWKSRCSFLGMQPGQCMIFSSTLMHGNQVNRTDVTRVSINVRFKGLFSPYSQLKHSEKKLGNFYRPFRISPVTRMALRYEEPNGRF